MTSVPFGGRPRQRPVVVIAAGGRADAGAGAGAVSTVCATGMQGMSGEAEKAHNNYSCCGGPASGGGADIMRIRHSNTQKNDTTNISNEWKQLKHFLFPCIRRNASLPPFSTGHTCCSDPLHAPLWNARLQLSDFAVFTSQLEIRRE